MKQQTLAGVRLIMFMSICFVTAPTNMYYLLSVLLKQHFYMASILQSLHIPALNGNQHTRKNQEVSPLNFTFYCM
jgi:hypothetical protein